VGYSHNLGIVRAGKTNQEKRKVVSKASLWGSSNLCQSLPRSIPVLRLLTPGRLPIKVIRGRKQCHLGEPSYWFRKERKFKETWRDMKAAERSQRKNQ